MAIFALPTGSTYYAAIWGFNGTRWNGSAMVAPSAIADTAWGTGMVTLVALSTSNSSATGMFTCTAPAALPAGFYFLTIHNVNTFEGESHAIASMKIAWNGAAEVQELPAAAAGTSGGLLVVGTGSGGVNPSGGKVPATIAIGDNADKSGYSINGTSGGTGVTASVALEDIYATAFKNGAVALYARVYKNGADITTADLSTIVYSVYLLDGGDPDERTAIAGHTGVSLLVSSVIFDTLQSDLEAGNYNFKHTVPAGVTPAFTIAGRDYLVEYTLTPTAGEKIIVRFRIEVK